MRWPYAWSGFFRCGDRLALPCAKLTVLPALSVLVGTSHSNTCFCFLPLLFIAIALLSYVLYFFTFCDSLFYMQRLYRLLHRLTVWHSAFCFEPGSFTCTLVSPLVTIRYHNFGGFAIRNTIQNEQCAIVENTELRYTRTKIN